MEAHTPFVPNVLLAASDSGHLVWMEAASGGVSIMARAFDLDAHELAEAQLVASNWAAIYRP